MRINGAATGYTGTPPDSVEDPQGASGAVTPDWVLDKQDRQSPPGGDGFVPPAGTGGVDLADPRPRKEETSFDGTPTIKSGRFSGPLFQDGASEKDVQQGKVGDCYFAAGMSSLAFGAKEAVQNMVRQNPDGTYTVDLFTRQGYYGPLKKNSINVDGDLYLKPTGTPYYGRSAGDKTATGMEMWYPIVEKAFAKLNGDNYSDIEGGYAAQVFEAVLGQRGRSMSLSQSSERVWKQIRQAIDGGYPVCAATFSDESKYMGTGVYANHMYSVIGYEEQDGERYVKLRNPWGVSEPVGNGPDDGEFRLKLADFRKLYQSMEWVEA